MNKPLKITFYLTLVCSIVFAQNRKITDSLLHQVALAKSDTSRVLTLVDLAWSYEYLHLDSSIWYGKEAFTLAKQIRFLTGAAHSMNSLGYLYRIIGDLPTSMDYQLRGFEMASSNHLEKETVACLEGIGWIYFDLADYGTAISYFQRARSISVTIQRKDSQDGLLRNIAFAFLKNHQLDSASFYITASYNERKALKLKDNGFLYFVMGDIEFQQGSDQVAFAHLKESVVLSIENNSQRDLSSAYNTLARFFKKMNRTDSCIYYAKLGLAVAQKIQYNQLILVSSNLLAEQYESKDYQQALYYYKLYQQTTRDLYGVEKVQGLQKALLAEGERQRIAEAQEINYKNALKLYSLLAGLAAFLLIIFILYRNNIAKQKSNKRLENTVSTLKATQSQLIQSEKMASLGVLTAGIAHEIQNPLNFVNNFSDLNKELATELQQELKSGKIEEAISISNDIIRNEEKINHHGKRADSIVKGMLLHSRTNTGIKEPTDVNALTNEYLRLSYQGLRAKEKDFNATMTTQFDQSIGLINIIPQDIGRVLLNLLNNAFYSVSEKKKTAGAGYEPTISVSTKKSADRISISVEDNGNGIPKNILDKIFQPFFTTKPTGLGTGLGLSLSYDIVKAHNGEIQVKTKEGESSAFTIILPI